VPYALAVNRPSSNTIVEDNGTEKESSRSFLQVAYFPVQSVSALLSTGPVALFAGGGRGVVLDTISPSAFSGPERSHLLVGPNRVREIGIIT